MSSDGSLGNASLDRIAQFVVCDCYSNANIDPGFTAAAIRQRPGPAIRFDGGFIFCLQTD